MAISYSAITNYGKITLPSVESFGANMNILRDPPKSITTRRIDKVGETSEITSMIDDSPERISGLNEYILQFARGINPMVEVSFDGWNGGGNGKLHQQSQGKLPYRILHGGAFRPPIRDQREILPLSRLPRTATSSFTNPGFADFSKKTLCFNPDKDSREIKSTPLKQVQPTAVYIFPSTETRTNKPLETKNYIKEKLLQVPVTSGKVTSARFNGEKGVPVKEVKEKMMKAPVNFNKGGTSKKNSESKVEVERYTKDVLQGKYSTNNSQNINVNNIDDTMLALAIKSTKDTMNISHEGYRRGPEKMEYIHGDLQAERNLPVHEQSTNSGRNIHKSLEDVVYREFSQNRPTASMQTNSRGIPGVNQGMEERQDYQLKPTLSLGGYEMNVKMPETYHENYQVEFDKNRENQRRKVYDMQQERNLSLGSIPYSPFETPV